MGVRRGHNGSGTYPLPLTLEGVVEHMRGDALAFMATRGPDDLVGPWLWRLAQQLEDQHTDAWAARLAPPDDEETPT